MLSRHWDDDDDDELEVMFCVHKAKSLFWLNVLMSGKADCLNRAVRAHDVVSFELNARSNSSGPS